MKKLTPQADNRCFGCGAANARGMMLEFEADEERKRIIGRFRLAAEYQGGPGFLHGGIIATVADTTAALALIPMLPRRTRMATVEMKINFLERVHAGRIRVVAWIVRKGKSLAVGEADVKDLKGRLLAKSLMTYSFSPPR